jgi:hypothetical protein
MNGGTADGETFYDLPIASPVIVGMDSFIGDRFSFEECYPNPAKDKTTIRFKTNSAYHVNINLYNKEGKTVKIIAEGLYQPGTYEVETDVSALPNGMYICEFKCGFFKDSKKLVISK